MPGSVRTELPFVSGSLKVKRAPQFSLCLGNQRPSLCLCFIPSELCFNSFLRLQSSDSETWHEQVFLYKTTDFQN